MEKITVQRGKTFVVGSQTFRPGIVIPERIIKVYRVKKYPSLYKKTFITLEKYLEQGKEAEKQAEEESENDSEEEMTDEEFSDYSANSEDA